MLISVDLPAPFSPTMPVMAPLAMASDTPRTACTLPNDFWMPESSIAGAAITQAPQHFDFPAFPVFPAESPGGRPLRRPPTGCGPSASWRVVAVQRKAIFWESKGSVRDHGYNDIITMVINYASAIGRPRHLQALLLM